MATRIAHPGIVTIGQEHMHPDHHAPALRSAMRRRLRRLDAFVVLTEGHRARYRRLLRGRGRVEVVPNTVRPLPGPKADPAARTIFAAGRLVDQKGFDLLLEAFAPVAAAHPDWRLRICGHGPRHGALAARVARLGLEHAVSLEPPTTDIGADMAAASVFALSSRFEGFPLVLLEAMSKGMAVAAFDCPTGPADIVEHRRNGLLVPRRDVAALSAALLELVEDEELRRRCGRAAAVTAQRWAMPAIGPRWDALLAELAAARGLVPASPTEITRARAARHATEPYAEVA
jgi:glycosyltransferase involved in cell wall biosynthesis